MTSVASAINLWNKPSKEELERDAVCKAFVKILEYMDRNVDKNLDGQVSIEDLTVYIADCGIKLNEEHLEDHCVENFIMDGIQEATPWFSKRDTYKQTFSLVFALG